MNAPCVVTRRELEYWPDTALRVARLAARPWFVFLDSCRFAPGAGRYDIVAWDPRLSLTTNGMYTTIEDAGGRRRSHEDPLALLRAALGPTGEPQDLPFSGGAIGAFSYDLARRWERMPVHAARDIELPEMAVGIYDRALIVDHLEQRAWFVHRGLCSAEVEVALSLLAIPRTLTPAVLGPRFVVNSAVSPELSLAEYAAGFARIKRYLTDGDCYQVNFTQRFSARAAGDPFDAYLRLRRLNPAPFAAFMRLPDAALLCSSPERFIVVREGVVETRPIKGTRPRAQDPLHDRALAVELAASAKDRAENVMIVDLLRNDLGKSCVTGSVRVPELCAVESYARVHHLVSSVRGELRAEVDALELWRGCFPGGSVTGAPKRRAMEIIEELEPTRRSIYCGAIGYLAHDGQMDSNIAIRTLLFQGERLYCWAGGGIVIDSELEAEYQESLDKAAALLNVFADASVPTWIVKIGGAMLEAAELPAWLAACGESAAQGRRCVIVSGGGALADQVRALQARWRFDDSAAHELALDTMRLNARLLSSLVPQLSPCEVLHEAELMKYGVGALLWRPPAQFRPEALPASWAVTSDSIALWLAQALSARALVLVKSLAPAQLRADTAMRLAAAGVIDSHFPTLLAAAPLPVRLISKTGVAEFRRGLESGTLPGVAVTCAR